jgi:hypothetical protein
LQTPYSTGNTIFIVFAGHIPAWAFAHARVIAAIINEFGAFKATETQVRT